MELTEEKLRAVVKAPEELRDRWTETQKFIARTVRQAQQELESEDFDGDEDNGTDQR